MKGYGSYKVNRCVVELCYVQTRMSCLHISEQLRMQTQAVDSFCTTYTDTLQAMSMFENMNRHLLFTIMEFMFDCRVYHNLIRTYFQHLSNMTQGLCRSILYIMFSFSTAHIHNIYIYTYICVLSMLGRIRFSAM